MLRGSLVLGVIRGIPIRIHFTWLIIFGLLSWSLASGYFPQHYPDLPITAYWIKAIIAALFLFGSVLVHELMHALMAQSLRVPIAGITLFALGGVSEMKQEPPSPSAEFMIAIVGPLASFALAGFFWLVWRVLAREGSEPSFAAIALYLVGLNTVVAMFNLLPAFPLDGGRVLRSIIWGITKNLKKATYLATRVGRAFAYLLITFGAVSLFAGAGFQGIWMALIGVFPPTRRPGELHTGDPKGSTGGDCRPRHHGERGGECGTQYERTRADSGLFPDVWLWGVSGGGEWSGPGAGLARRCEEGLPDRLCSLICA